MCDSVRLSSEVSLSMRYDDDRTSEKERPNGGQRGSLNCHQGAAKEREVGEKEISMYQYKRDIYSGEGDGHVQNERGERLG